MNVTFGGMSPSIGPTGAVKSQVMFAAKASAKNPASGDDFFCKTWRGDLPNRRIVAENKSAFAVFDGYGLNPGHTLVVPKRHVASFFETTDREKKDLVSLLGQCKELVAQAYQRKHPDEVPDWNIGINDGPKAGRTVNHLHMHLIPRVSGDMADPKGGVRGVIPDKQKYSGPPDTSPSDELLDFA